MEPIVKVYNKRKAKVQLGALLTLTEITDLLVQILDAGGQTTICIDALDEIDRETRLDLLKTIKHVIQKSKNVVKILATSRNDVDITMNLREYPHIDVKPADNKDDIIRFIKLKVQNNNALFYGENSEQLKQEICERLSIRCEGM